MNNELFNECLNKISSNISILPDKPEETPSNTLKALWLKASGISASVLKSEDIPLPELSDEQVDKLSNLIDKRLEGIPVAYLTGRQSFMELEMLAGPEALIPRKETEILGYVSVEILKSLPDTEINVIDVCTGAGNIALALANSASNAKVYASDLSEEAVELARKNADFLGLSEQTEFLSGDLLEPFTNLDLYKKVSLLTCNPPYISSSKVAEMPDEISDFEPSLAFDGGAFGVNLIRRLITDAEKFLCTGGYLAFEVGLGQGTVVKKQVEKSSIYSNIKIVNDELGQPRVITAQKL